MAEENDGPKGYVVRLGKVTFTNFIGTDQNTGEPIYKDGEHQLKDVLKKWLFDPNSRNTLGDGLYKSLEIRDRLNAGDGKAVQLSKDEFEHLEKCIKGLFGLNESQADIARNVLNTQETTLTA